MSAEPHGYELLAPRRPGSAWARSNKQRVARLERDGAMAPAGRRCVDAARNFAAFTDAGKRTILRWLIDAKRPEMRGKRVEETVRLAAKNERAGP